MLGPELQHDVAMSRPGFLHGTDPSETIDVLRNYRAHWLSPVRLNISGAGLLDRSHYQTCVMPQWLWSAMRLGTS